MPSFIFIDREGNDLGLLMHARGWRVGEIVERESGRYRVVEIIETNLPDIDGLVPILVEPVRDGNLDLPFDDLPNGYGAHPRSS